MAIRVIPAKPAAKTKTEYVPEITRAAAYCRVSTDLTEQESSYEAQKWHYETYISHHDGWVLAGIYADEGITGTGVEKRTEFQRMIRDCESGKIDMVITKSISRFARNTLDCLKYIRRLKARNIPILFEKENINTLDAKGEILITIMASIAQQESLSISQNVTMGIRYGFQQGKVRVNHNQFLGYTRGADGQLVIVPEQAEVVRRIYRSYLEGFSTLHIAGELEREGVLTGPGRTKWYESTVRNILHNEKYMGDLLLQKSYTVDFLTHRVLKNTGQLPQYYVENDHDAIIPRPIFFQVQSEFKRRAEESKVTGKLPVYGSKRALTGRLICGKCGSIYRRFTRRHDQTVWKCPCSTGGNAECSGRTVREVDLKKAVISAMNQLPKLKYHIGEQQVKLQEQIRRIDIELEEMMSSEKRDGLDLFQVKAELNVPEGEPPGAERDSSRMFELKMRRAECAMQEVKTRVLLGFIRCLEFRTSSNQYILDPGGAGDRTGLSPACDDVDDFYRRTDHEKQIGPVKGFDDAQIIRYIENVTVVEERYIVYFKAGVSISIYDTEQ